MPLIFNRLKTAYEKRTGAGNACCEGTGKFVPRGRTVDLLNAVIRRGDRVCIEGDNQKQADFLARSLLKVNRRKVRDLHLVQSSIVLHEHVELFRKGIASRLDFAYSGPQAKQLYKLATEKKAKIGAIHTYLELYARYFIDLNPQVALVVAEASDEEGNLFTGFNTEDTPLICEATRFKYGIVVAQVTRKVKKLPRVDIPADWVDYVVETGEPYHLQPLFTRDPAKITDRQVLMAMMTLKGIYQEYGIRRLNHGVGYATAAIELILPTYGRQLGLKGGCCTHWILNPIPTLIPAIEAGFVETVYSFGGEPGMEDYVKGRSDVFAIGKDGEMRSNRAFAHMAGLYAIDCFAGATLQVDRFGNSSTAIDGMITGFGGAPNLGCTAAGRKHGTAPYRKAGTERHNNHYGRKLVVQITPTKSEKKGIPVFVNDLYANKLYEEGLFEAPPVMIDGEQVTHIVTEEGIAYLDTCPDVEVRQQAIAAVAGDTEVGRSVDAAVKAKLRQAGIVRTPDNLGIDVKTATTDLLAAHSLDELVEISGGLYRIPDVFQNDI